MDAIAVPVELCNVFAKRLGQTVIAVRAAQAIGAQHLILLVKAHHMVGAGEHHALNPVAARALIDVQYALDVGFQNVFKGVICGQAAHVHDRIAAIYQPVNGLFVGQLAGLNLFSRGCGVHGGDVRQPHLLRVGPQAGAQVAAQFAGSTGEQKAGNHDGRSCGR